MNGQVSASRTTLASLSVDRNPKLMSVLWMKKIISSLLTIIMLLFISTSVFAEDIASTSNDPYAPTVTYVQNGALRAPNGITITVSPSYSSLGVYVGNIGVDALDNVTVSGTATNYGALAPKSGSVPAVVGRTFVWNVLMDGL